MLMRQVLHLAQPFLNWHAYSNLVTFVSRVFFRRCCCFVHIFEKLILVMPWNSRGLLLNCGEMFVGNLYRPSCTVYKIYFLRLRSAICILSIRLFKLSTLRCSFLHGVEWEALASSMRSCLLFSPSSENSAWFSLRLLRWNYYNWNQEEKVAY